MKIPGLGRKLPTLLAALLLAGLTGSLLAQGRTVRKIKVPEKPTSAASTITPEQCREAVHKVAQAWGSENLRNALDPDFPNRSELIDAIRRSTLRGTNVVLAVEAVEGVRFTPAKDGRSTDCIADVSTRLQFDDPATGERRSASVGRGQWRIRFDLPKR